MDNRMRELINDLTEEIVRLYELDIQNDINKIVEDLGGKIIEDSKISDYEGAVRKVDDKNFEIIVPRDQNENRKRFTIAHELGHLFLHMGFLINQEVWNKQKDGELEYFRHGLSELEYQANEFAAALLMPRSEYEKILEENTTNNIVNTIEIAEHFHVSVDARSTRGKFLGYLKW